MTWLDPRAVKPAPLPEAPASARLTAGDLAAIELGGVLGEGGFSEVRAATWKGRAVALKLYKPRALQRSVRKHPLPVAEFEYRRNLAFHSAPGLGPYVAEPLAYASGDSGSALVQERLDGQLFYFHHRDVARGAIDPAFSAQLARIVELAHAAGLYDVDLHAMNVMVVEGPEGQPWPKLFDFNLVPFHEHAPNPLVGFLLATGLMSPRARDLRKLRRFHDFRRVERKLLGFYDDAPGAGKPTA